MRFQALVAVAVNQATAMRHVFADANRSGNAGGCENKKNQDESHVQLTAENLRSFRAILAVRQIKVFTLAYCASQIVFMTVDE